MDPVSRMKNGKMGEISKSNLTDGRAAVICLYTTQLDIKPVSHRKQRIWQILESQWATSAAGFHTHTSVLKSCSSWILHFAIHLYFHICSWKYDQRRFFCWMFWITQKLHIQIKCTANICRSTTQFCNNTSAKEYKKLHKIFKTFHPSLHCWDGLQSYFFLLAEKWSSPRGFKPKPS